MPANKDVSNYKAFIPWVAALYELDNELWTAPIAKGKWSISEIIAHILNWDNHLISQVLPSVRQGKEIRFPNIDTYNKLASDYAKSGISQAALIEEVIRTREHLIAQLLEMPDDLYQAQLTYSLAFIIEEFVLHDNEHKEQMIQFLNKSK